MVCVLATGSYLPEQIVANSALTQFPPSALPLIEQKTGVKERRHARRDQCTSDLAYEAARRCLDLAAVAPPQLDTIILATSSPDRTQPATAARLQYLLGATTACAFDLNSVCSGAVYALHVGAALIRAGSARRVLVVAAEVYSKILNPSDFSTYPYFGDGAGAVLLAEGPGRAEIVDTILRTDGSGHDIIQIPVGGTMRPYQWNSNPADIYFRMNGKEVYKFAISRGTEVVQEIIAKNGLRRSEIAHVVLHQANANIIREIAERLEIPLERFPVHLDRYGNTAAASVLIALDELFAANDSPAGQSVILAAFGGGLSWGACLLRLAGK